MFRQLSRILCPGGVLAVIVLNLKSVQGRPKFISGPLPSGSQSPLHCGSCNVSIKCDCKSDCQCVDTQFLVEPYVLRTLSQEVGLLQLQQCSLSKVWQQVQSERTSQLWDIVASLSVWQKKYLEFFDLVIFQKAKETRTKVVRRNKEGFPEKAPLPEKQLAGQTEATRASRGSIGHGLPQPR